MKVLRQGSKGPEVGLLRRMLNKQVKPSPGLPEVNVFGPRYNGAVATIDFGPKMDQAVRTFQQSKRLKVDGIVGPRTWGALSLQLEINNQVTLQGQPSNDTCYAASASMILGPQGSLSYNAGATPPGIDPGDYWAQQYANLFGWKLEYGQSWTVIGLSHLLRSGPLWMAGNYLIAGKHSYHAVVLGSIWGNNLADQAMLLIYDPWPPPNGETYGVIFLDWTTQNPDTFRYILHK